MINALKRDFWLLCFASFIFIGCNQYEIGDGAKWTGKKKLELKKIFTLGTKDVNATDQLFGDITGIATDKINNIYVADGRLFKIKKYDSNGEFLDLIAEGNGKKPGQFIDLRGISIDAEGKIYAQDFYGQRVTIFKSDGKVFHSISFPFMLASSALDKDGYLYIILYKYPQKFLFSKVYSPRGFGW